MPITRRRILVVDDNVDAAESLATILRLGGHEVDSHATASKVSRPPRALIPTSCCSISACRG
jgi:CheY-like chemotaxis protein